MIKNKVCGVYKIENTITGDFYIGSSKDVKKRWAHHKYPSQWKYNPNSPMYKDMQRYGVENFEFTILCEVESEQLKETEQEFIEMLQPTYNQMYAKGLDIERRKEYKKEYNQSEKGKYAKRKYMQSEKGKETIKKHSREYMQSEEGKEAIRKYRQSEKGKEIMRNSQRKFSNQPCLYKGEMVKLGTLSERFRRAGVKHPTSEAKKYLIKTN